MNQITNPPLESDFGYDFNYALWTAETRVSLVNVPWNNDYRDVVKFADRDALNTYIDNRETPEVVMEDLSYVKPNTPIRIDLPFNKVYKFNYLRARNPLQPVNGDVLRDLYYFITDVRYVAPNTTEIVVQLDVFQTFIYDVQFGNCYIERGHIGIANKKNFDNWGRDYLTIPEGLDVGNEYQVITKRTEKVMRVDGELGVGVQTNAILVASTVDLTADAGTVTAPVLKTAPGGFFQVLPSGASYYVFKSAGAFLGFMSANAETPWKTQGIISITMIPDLARYIPGFTYAEGSEPTPTPVSFMRNLKHNMFLNWRTNAEILNKIPARYRHLKKFMTYPYMAVEMTTFTGTPIVVKPEAWNSSHATIIERPVLVPPNQRIAFHPHKYNARKDSPTEGLHETFPAGTPNYGGDDYGDYVDFETIINNFPTFAIVNNGAISYMAQNSHAIAYQRASADWSQQRALRGNEVAYDQASAGMQLANQLTGTATGLDAAQTALMNNTILQQGMLGAVGGIAGGAGQGALGGAAAGPAGAAVGGAMGAIGGGVGAITGAIGTGIQMNQNANAQALRSAAANVANSQQTGNQGYVRDTNKNLADWAAKGDYENTIAGLNARTQDAQLIQPTTSGQVGGEAMNIVHNNFGVSLRWKLIDNASIRRIGEYWLRYGYAVREFATLSKLTVMTKFTYWKLAETYIISAPMPETFKQAIRGIFEKGVTVWVNPNDIGNIDIADNTPLGGITL